MMQGLFGKFSKKRKNKSTDDNNKNSKKSQKSGKNKNSNSNKKSSQKANRKSKKNNNSSSSSGGGSTGSKNWNSSTNNYSSTTSSSKKSSNRTSKKNSSKKKKKFVIEVKGPNDKLKESYTHNDVLAYELPLIRNYANDIEKRKLAVTRKLRLCSVIYNFGELLQLQNESIINEQTNIRNHMQINVQNLEQLTEYREKQSRGIEKKRQMLVEIVEFISTQTWWDEQILQELIRCLHRNLFRTLPTKGDRKAVKGDEEEEPFQDPAWLHLQLVYELCLRFLIANDINKKVMQKYLFGSFVLNLIQLFSSEDLRERDYLKTILHRIYGRFMPLRLQIRTAIADECYRYVYSRTRKVHGIAEFLDIFSSIINGFSIPVKEEHKAFLRNVLIPLHKCDKYDIYFQQLADCCVLFVNKEQSIASTILGGLLKFWPHLSPTKEAFYLREMLNVMGALVEHENGFSYSKYKDILLLCIQKIFQCMLSPHFQVCEQAMTLWKDTVMLYLSKCEKDIIWMRLFIIFKRNSELHWNPGIKILTTEVIQYYERIDSLYWKKLEEQYQNDLNSKSASTMNSIGENEITDDTNNNITNTNGNSNENSESNSKPLPITKPETLDPRTHDRNLQRRQQQKFEMRANQWRKLRSTAESMKSLNFADNNINDSTYDMLRPGPEPDPNLFVVSSQDPDQDDQKTNENSNTNNNNNNSSLTNGNINTNGHSNDSKTR